MDLRVFLRKLGKRLDLSFHQTIKRRPTFWSSLFRTILRCGVRWVARRLGYALAGIAGVFSGTLDKKECYMAGVFFENFG